MHEAREQQVDTVGQTPAADRALRSVRHAEVAKVADGVSKPAQPTVATDVASTLGDQLSVHGRVHAQDLSSSVPANDAVGKPGATGEGTSRHRSHRARPLAQLEAVVNVACARARSANGSVHFGRQAHPQKSLARRMGNILVGVSTAHSNSAHVPSYADILDGLAKGQCCGTADIFYRMRHDLHKAERLLSEYGGRSIGAKVTATRTLANRYESRVANRSTASLGRALRPAAGIVRGRQDRQLRLSRRRGMEASGSEPQRRSVPLDCRMINYRRWVLTLGMGKDSN